MKFKQILKVLHSNQSVNLCITGTIDGKLYEGSFYSLINESKNLRILEKCLNGDIIEICPFAYKNNDDSIYCYFLIILDIEQ